MVEDETKQSESTEDDDIIVELPEEDLDEADTKTEESTEEPSDTEVAEEEDDGEEETETVSEEDEGNEPEAKEDPKADKVFGKRAEKRIKRLVAQKKELEEKLKSYEEEKLRG